MQLLLRHAPAKNILAYLGAMLHRPRRGKETGRGGNGGSSIRRSNRSLSALTVRDEGEMSWSPLFLIGVRRSSCEAFCSGNAELAATLSFPRRTILHVSTWLRDVVEISRKQLFGANNKQEFAHELVNRAECSRCKVCFAIGDQTCVVVRSLHSEEVEEEIGSSLTK